MKQSDINKLKKGDIVEHTRYGLCSVDKVMKSFGSFFGLVIIPLSEKGKDLLANDSGTGIKRFLEDSIRRIKKNKNT
jgi:hypothetical protein